MSRVSGFNPNQPWTLEEAIAVRAKSLNSMNARAQIVGAGSTDGDAWFQKYQAMFNAADNLVRILNDEGVGGVGQ